jgi:hypothetical protein
MVHAPSTGQSTFTVLCCAVLSVEDGHRQSELYHSCSGSCSVIIGSGDRYTGFLELEVRSKCIQLYRRDALFAQVLAHTSGA